MNKRTQTAPGIAPQPQPTPEPTPERARVGDDALIGTQIDERYQVLAVLGSGGTGILYRVRHLTLDKELALKLLRPAFVASQETVSRFRKEARTAAAASHRNLVEVYDLGELPDGRPYLVMPLLVGRDLSQDRHRLLPATRVVELLRGPAEALDTLHDKGLVHRDIKPSNLMLCQEDDGSEVTKILDFGLATLMISSEKRLTQEGTYCGTPAYIAPEAALGEIPDARGDVYSLAVVALLLCTGKRPFDGGGAAHFLHSKVKQDAPRVAELLGQEVPAAVERLFAQALARDPNRRTRRCSEFIEQLARVAPDWTVARPTATLSSEAETSSMASVPRGPEDDSSTALPYASWSRSRWLALAAGIAVLAFVAWLAARPSGSSMAEAHQASEPEAPPHESALAASTQAPPNERLAAVPVEATRSADDAPPPAEPAGRDHLGRDRARAGRAGATAAPATHEGAATMAPPLETRLPSLDVDPELARAEGLTRDAAAALVHGFVPRAFSLYRLASQVQPRHAPAWRGLGVAASRLGRSDDARRAFRRYLALAPDAADASVIRRRLQSATP